MAHEFLNKMGEKSLKKVLKGKPSSASSKSSSSEEEKRRSKNSNK